MVESGKPDLQLINSINNNPVVSNNAKLHNDDSDGEDDGINAEKLLHYSDKHEINDFMSESPANNEDFTLNSSNSIRNTEHSSIVSPSPHILDNNLLVNFPSDKKEIIKIVPIEKGQGTSVKNSASNSVYLEPNLLEKENNYQSLLQGFDIKKTDPEICTISEKNLLVNHVQSEEKVLFENSSTLSTESQSQNGIHKKNNSRFKGIVVQVKKGLPERKKCDFDVHNDKIGLCPCNIALTT